MKEQSKSLARNVLPPGSQTYAKALRNAQGDQPDWEAVLRLLDRAIDEGSAEAMYAKATWYLAGKDPHISKNIAKAMVLLRKAASGGVASAMFDLAVSYETGVGVKKNEKKAFEFYLRAALNMDEDAVGEVGRCYYHGIGVTRDRRIGKIWIEHSIVKGATGVDPFSRRDL
ncbi:MAG: sel1 repeat family protein [bacterium]|nr:sel1 repeat family protein [bacterium]